MTKRAVSLLLAAVLLLPAVSAALAESQTLEEILGIDPADWPRTMYVYTESGDKLNVRRQPWIGDNIIDQLEYGAEVTVEGPVVINADWYAIRHPKGDGGIAYVMGRYLVNARPEDADTREEKERNLEELNRQLASERTVERPFTIAVRATRVSGWINFRSGPGVAAERLFSLPDGRLLRVTGETESWYRAVDSETGTAGYISKNYVTVLTPSVREEAPAKEQMGKLNVNGEFALQCRLPEGYTMQLINSQGNRIGALITPEDTEKPILQLSVAFDEMYAGVDRMNDLSEEALKALEETFSEMNDVEITYRNTAYGTKLLIAREVGDQEDFVDIMSVYKGYSVEFVMTPNPGARDQSLTGEQIQMCVDFLSELDFVPAA